MINVTLLGTGGMLPLPDRWLTSLWVEFNGKACLIDCGEGTQIAAAKHGVKLSHLDLLLITHTHADHISGLPGLLLSLGNCGKTDTLVICGHKGIRTTIASLLCICPVLPFPLEIRELPTDECSSFEWNDMIVSTLPLDHSVECLGYSFVLNRKPVFDPEKARELGIPVNLWKELHSGNTVELNGSRITQEMVISGSRKPLKVTYMTDTRFFGGMAGFAENSDLLICEGMYGSDEYVGKMREKGHMVFSQAAETAKCSGSKELWLTHYSPAMTDPNEYAGSVRSIFANTIISRDGERTVIK